MNFYPGKGARTSSERFDIGFNIDAEEADDWNLSLDLLEDLCLDTDLAGWNGMGFVVQAMASAAHSCSTILVDLARRAGRRIMIRAGQGRLLGRGDKARLRSMDWTDSRLHS